MDLAGLREHIISLLDSADEDQLAAVIRAMEGGAPPPRADSPTGMFEESKAYATSVAGLDMEAVDTVPQKQNVAANLFGPTGSGSVTARGGTAPNTARSNRGGAAAVAAALAGERIPLPSATPPQIDSARNGARQPTPRGIVAAAAAGLKEAEDGAEGEDAVESLEVSRRDRNANGRRIAVSAMPMQMDKVREFEARVIEKQPDEFAELAKVVASCHLFSSLDEKEQHVIVNAMDQEMFSGGADILKEGEITSDPRFYLIFDGNVAVVKDGKNVATMGAGQSFGELEMMYDSAEPNAATIRCVTDCAMYWIDRDTYRNIVLKATLNKRKTHKKMIERVAFTEAMSDYDKDTLADCLQQQRYERDDCIIRFGEKGQWMHFIMDGEVQVVGRERGQKKNIIKLGVGEPLGELEFLFNHLTVADVVAISPVVRTLRVSRKHFETCFGPITDELKKFVAKGKYEHYLKEADHNVRHQLTVIEKKAERQRVADVQKGIKLSDIERTGEALMVVEKTEGDLDEDGRKPQQMYRFPLSGIHQHLVVIGLREDGVIMAWNDTIARITSFSESEVVGQSIYSFLGSLTDQQHLHRQLGRAQTWAGDVEGFNAALAEEEEAHKVHGHDELGGGAPSPLDPPIVFVRSDGLTKSQVKLQIYPPTVATRNQAQMLFAVGGEVRQRPPSKELDNGQWLAEQLKDELDNAFRGSADPKFVTEEKEKDIGEVPVSARNIAIRGDVLKQLLAKFDSLQQRGSTENLRSVNIKQLIGLVVSEYQNAALDKGCKIDQSIEGELPEELYCDTEVLTKLLRYAINNSVKHCQKANIRVNAAQVEDFGIDYFEVAIEDDGPGIDESVIKMFQRAVNGHVHRKFEDTSMNKMRAACVRLGGQMLVESVKMKRTCFKFRVPFINVEDASGPGGAGESENTDSAMSASVKNRQQKMTFTTLVVEGRPVHRNMLCGFLWERKHAVLPAQSWSDVLRLIGTSDILVVDPQQQSLANDPAVQDPIAFLREKARKMAVVITADTFDETTRSAYHAAGFQTLTKPCTALQASAVFRRAEEKMAQIKAESDRIAALRSMFSGGKTDREKKNWKKGKLLGKGAFGEVWEAIDRLTSGKMAVKIMRIGRNMNKEVVKQEIETMCTLKHDNIIHYFYAEDATDGGFDDAASVNPGSRPRSAGNERGGGDLGLEGQEYINVFMELAAGGTLEGRVKDKAGLEAQELVKILRDVVEGVAYIHSQRFIHCDLKTANVLFGLDDKAKIGDFGTAKRLKEGEMRYDMAGTLLYMSPECMSADEEEDIGYDFKADIWSLGAMAMEMFTGRPPLSHLGMTGTLAFTKYITELEDAPDLSCLFDAPPNVFEFVRSCMDIDPAKRPTAVQLLDSSLLREGEGDGDLKTAMKALKRAQLLHVLNAFKAFRDPEEEEEEERRRAAEAKKMRGGGDSGFFSSDEDEDDEEDGPPKKKAGGVKVSAGDFFDTDEEEEDEEEEDDDDPDSGAATAGRPSQQAEGGARGSEAPTAPAVLGEQRSSNSPPVSSPPEVKVDTPPSTPVPVVFQASGMAESGSEDPRRCSATAGRKPSTMAASNMKKSCRSIDDRRSVVIQEVCASPDASTEPGVAEPTLAPASAPAGDAGQQPKQRPPAVPPIISPHFRHRVATAAVAAAATPAAGAANGRPEIGSSVETTTAAIVLHDAILGLLERIKHRCNVTVPLQNDQLREQYDSLRRKGSGSGGPGMRFEPDVAALLQRDAAMLADAAARLTANPGSTAEAVTS